MRYAHAYPMAVKSMRYGIFTPWFTTLWSIKVQKITQKPWHKKKTTCDWSGRSRVVWVGSNKCGLTLQTNHLFGFLLIFH